MNNLSVAVVHLRKYTFVGGYPLFYVGGHSNINCADCAEECILDSSEYRKNLTSHVNWESTELYCDLCSEQIESAYGDDEVSVEDES